jgi:hypothetical protein
MPFGNKMQFLGDPFWRKRVRSGHTTLEKKRFLSPVVFRARERYVAVRTTYLGFDPFSYLRLAKKRVIFYPSKPGTWPTLWVGWVGINSFIFFHFYLKTSNVYWFIVLIDKVHFRYHINTKVHSRQSPTFYILLITAKLCDQVPSLSLSRWRTLTLLKI